MKVLIVDDEPLVRRSLKRAFELQGHEVIEAPEGRSGLKKWKEFHPAVIFLDILMPGLSGPAVLQEMQSDVGRFKSKVILISAYSGDHNFDTAQKLGADLFIAKPFEDIFALVKIAEGLIK